MAILMGQKATEMIKEFKNLPNTNLIIDFEKIIYPHNVREFVNNYFEIKPLLISRNNCSYFESLLTISEINLLLERKDIHYPSIRLVKDGLELPQTDYLKNLPYGNQVFEGLIENDRLFTLFSEGCTIVFQALHRTLPSLATFCRSVESFFKIPVQTNIYLTPTSSQGFAPHFDNHDVFILQTYGSKFWRVYDSPQYLPTKPFDKQRWKKSKPSIEIELKEGDTLYIPRGFVHDAITSTRPSMHITLGLLTYTWIDVFKIMIEKSHEIPSFRKSFDWNSISTENFKVNVSELQNQLFNKVGFEDIKEEFNSRFAKKILSNDSNRLLDIINLNNIDVYTSFQVRKEIVFKISSEKENVILSFYNKTIKFPIYIANTLVHLLSLERFCICDLSDEIDEPGKFVLVKTLVKEGILFVKNV